MQAIKANGVYIHYDFLDGEGTPLVFANSLGTDFRVWDALLDELETEAPVLLWDKRGHGLSERTAAPYHIDDHAGDLMGLMDALDIDEAVIVGLSVGGAIAQRVAVTRPDLVKGLVLMDTAHKFGDPANWQQRIDAVTSGGIASISDAILDRWFSKDFRTNRKAEEAAWRNMLERTPVDGYAGTCAALRDFDHEAETRTIAVPTLCICGTEDGATTPEMVKALSELIDGAEFELVEGAGHLPCVEKPEETAELIDDFLAENDLG